MHMLGQVLTIILILILSNSTKCIDESWEWSWMCNSSTGKCTKTQFPNPLLDGKVMSGNYYGSLPLCRLSCDKYGAIWPRPKSINLAQQLIPFSIENMQFTISGADSTAKLFLLEVIDVFQSNLLVDCKNSILENPNTNVSVSLAVRKSSLDLKWDTDENYIVEINTDKDNRVTIEITAETVFGIRHGLETIGQLIAPFHTPHKQQAPTCSLAIVSKCRIEDGPTYAHRGLLLDTSRNFLPVNTIKKQIDGMAASKLNVFHWHATDSQSFPLHSPKVPQLSRFGAYSPDKIYHPKDVQDIIKYAKVRGVKVLLEIDSPSHAGNGWQWGKDEGLGDLAVCVNKQPWNQYCIQPPCGQFNPVNPNLYTILGHLYSDIIQTFDTDVFHMGGDEVFMPCWNSTKEIVDFLKQQGKGQSTEDFLYLWSLFQNETLRTFDFIKGNKNSSIILWTSDLTKPDKIQKYLSNSRYTIQTWVPSDSDIPTQLLNLGYKLIISTKNAWYLDHGFWGQTKYYQWQSVYMNRILKHRNVLGGEICMWGERADENSVDMKVWPRTAAFAERLWTDPDTNAKTAENRFNAHRERLVSKGIRADAIGPYYCYQNEGEC